MHFWGPFCLVPSPHRRGRLEGRGARRGAQPMHFGTICRRERPMDTFCSKGQRQGLVRSRGSDGRSILSAPLSLSLSLCNFSNPGPAREKTRVVFERRMNCKSFETRGNVDAILPSLSLDDNNIYICERYTEITLRLNRLFISIRCRM